MDVTPYPPPSSHPNFLHRMPLAGLVPGSRPPRNHPPGNRRPYLATNSIGGAQFTIMHSGFLCTFIVFPFVMSPEGSPGGEKSTLPVNDEWRRTGGSTGG